MADAKISALTELAAPPAVDDIVPLVDVSDTSEAASGTDKKIKAARLSPIIVRRSGDATAVNSGTTGSTLTNDDTLLWAVAANEVWFFEGFLLIAAANATMDFKWTVTGPSGATGSLGGLGVAGAAQSGYGYQTTAGTPIAMLGLGSALTVGTGIITAAPWHGIGIAGVVIVSSTPGNANFQFAQNTSDAGNLTLKANSFLRLTRLA